MQDNLRAQITDSFKRAYGFQPTLTQTELRLEIINDTIQTLRARGHNPSPTEIKNAINEMELSAAKQLEEFKNKNPDVDDRQFLQALSQIEDRELEKIKATLIDNIPYTPFRLRTNVVLLVAIVLAMVIILLILLFRVERFAKSHNDHFMNTNNSLNVGRGLTTTGG